MRKEINLLRAIALSNICRLSSPYKVTLVLTYRCNLRCEICRIWDHMPCQEMDVAALEKIFRSLRNLGWIDLTGGEITLREDLIDVIRVILRNSSRLWVVHLSTNGQLPDKAVAMADEVLAWGRLPVINVSVDGPRHINDKLRGRIGAFDNSLETFRRLKLRHPQGHYYLSCTLSALNIGHIDALIEELRAEIPGFDLSQIHFNFFHTSTHYYKNDRVDMGGGIDPRAVMKYVILSRKGGFLKYFLEDQYLKGLSIFMAGNRFPRICQALNATCFIDPKGTVYPCGIYDKPVGELKDYNYNINQVWEQSVTLAVRSGILKRKCSGCWSPCEAYPAILGSYNRR